MEPSMVITPLNPDVILPFFAGRGRFTSWGGVTIHSQPNRLYDHYNLDRLMVKADDNLDDNLSSGTKNWHRHSCFRIKVDLSPWYWRDDTQVIVIFDVETGDQSDDSSQDIQVFVGEHLVREETIDGRENIVIVYDFVPEVCLIIRPKTLNKRLRFYKAYIFIV